MTDIATLGIEARSDGIKEATLALRALPEAASAAERAVEKIRISTTAAGSTSEEFSRRVRRSMESLQFQQQQLTRSAADQERYNAVRRAGVTVESAAGQAISASVVKLQEQRQAQLQSVEAARQASASARAAQQQAEQSARAVAQVTAQLEFERAQLGRTAVQRAQFDAVRRAGVAVDSAEARGIMATVAALESEKVALARVEAARLAAARASTTGPTAMTAQQRLMLGYQLNDIFTQLSMGTNPLMVAAQQGPQITQIYGGLANTLARIPKPLLVGGAAAAGVGIAASVLNSVAEMNDALAEQQRRFTSLTGSGEQAAALYKDIAKFASDAGVSIDAATESTVAMARATASLGATRQNIMDIASVAEKLTQLSGASKEEGTAARGALSTMLKDSTVNAEQLRIVLGNVPQIADKIAAGLGLSTTQLKLLATQGDLTNRMVFDALVKQAGAVNSEFEKMPKSVGSTWQSLGDDLGQVLTRFSNLIPFVREYRMALAAAALAAKELNAATTPATPSQRATAAGGPSIYTDASNRIFRGANNPSAYYSALYDLGGQENSDTFSAIAAQAKAANDNLVDAVGLASKLDPIASQLQEINKQADIVEKALADLIAGRISGISGEESAQYVNRLTAALDGLRTKSLQASTEFGRALDAIQTRQMQNEIGMTPGQRAYASKIGQLASPGSSVSIDEARTVVDVQQLQMLDDLIAKEQLQVATQQAIAQGMRNGKAAADDAAVAMQIFGITLEQLGNLTPELQVKLDILFETMSNGRKALREQAGIDASKSFVAELAGIAAAMKAVEQGAYAMKRAEAEARAARDENGTGKLQMQVFDARQALTDATTLDGLNKQIKLTNDLAAAAGDVARQRAIQLDYDIKIAQLAAGPGARAQIETAMRADDAAKLNRELREGAVAMERDVDLAQQQLAIIRAGGPDMAAQLAMLARRNDLLAKGIDLTSEDAQKQITAAGNKARIDEQIGYAKEAADATKRTWMTAYDNIQSYGADTFYDLFRGVSTTGATVAEQLKNIFLRAFAEIAAAAVIRPIMAPIFQAGSALGIIPGGVVPAATGVTGGGDGSSLQQGTTGLGGLMGGGGLGSIFSGGGGGGWVGRQISGISDFLKSPLYSMGGDPLSSGAMGPTAPGLFNGSVSIGGALGGVASIGMGAYNAFSGKGTGSTIGGIAQMAGGVMMMIPGLQPFGAALSLLGGLGGLFDGGPKTPPQPALVYSGGYFAPNGQGGFTSADAGMLNGGVGLGSNMASVGSQLQRAFRTAGLTVNPSQLIGGAIGSGVNHVMNGGQWQDSPYTTTALQLPGGSQELLTNFDTGRDLNAASEYLLAQTFRANVLRGGVSGAGAGLTAGLDKINPETAEALENVIKLGTAYDQLGKTANPAKEAIDQVSAAFDDLKDYATKAGLSLDPINAELEKQSKRAAQDFIDNYLNPLAVQQRALQDQQDAALKSAEYIKEKFSDVYVDMNALTAAFAKQQTDLLDQAYGGAITNLQALIKSLTYGDLSNASPLTTMAGLRSDYAMTLDQARGGDATAIANFSTIAGQLADYGRRTDASGPVYEALRQQIIADTLEVQGVAGGGTTTASTASSVGATANDKQIAQLIAMQQQSNAKIDSLTEELAAVTAQLRRQNSSGSR